MTTSHTAQSVSRRTALAGLGAGALGLVLATRGLGASAQDASPVATPFPRTGHPLIGAWQWQWVPWQPPLSTDFAIFGADGLVVLASANPDDVSIGTWRATGARTVELVRVNQRIRSLEFMFEPDFVPPECAFEGNVMTGWMSLVVDEGGNALAATGYYEPRDETGAVIVHLEHDEFDGMQLAATRLIPVP